MIFLRLFAGYFVQTLPFAILGIYPFSGQFRFSAKRTYLGTLGIILFLDCIFSGMGCYLHRRMEGNARLYFSVDMLFALTLIPCFLWVLLVSKSIWQKKLFVFSFMLTSAFFLTFICNTISVWFRLDEPVDGLPYSGYSTLLILLLTVVVLPVLLLILKKGYMPVADSLTGKESAYLACFSIMLFFMLLGSSLVNDYNYIYNSATFFLYVALLAVTFFIYVVFFRLLSLSYEKMTASQESAYLKHQLEIRDEQYHRFNDSIEYNRRMHHDLKHHMLTIRGFLNEGKTAEAESYLDECIKLAEAYEITKLCDVLVINWIVSYYQALAKSKEITFYIRISAPPADEIEIQDSDLAVLLGNLLENAVTAADGAAGEARYIRLNIAHSGNMLVITVDNGFAGVPRRDGGRYLSTKKEHIGIGLRSIENIAEKYGGGVEFSHEENVFHSSVMLNVGVKADRKLRQGEKNKLIHTGMPEGQL